MDIYMADADKYPEGEFNDLLQYDDPVYEEIGGRIYVHEKCDNVTDKLLCKFFNHAYLSDTSIIASNLLSAAEYIGDYPVITPEQAVEQLRSGDYLTSVPEECIKENAEIYKIGLMYDTSNMDKYYQPYYIIAAATEYDDYRISSDETVYGYFYVPAIAPEYRTTEEELNKDKTVLPAIDWETAEGSRGLIYGLPVLENDPLGVLGTVYAEDIHDLDNLNPWSEELKLEKLPVFRDLSYNDEKMFHYLDEEQMRAAAEWAAHELWWDAQVIETVYSETDPLDPLSEVSNVTAVLRLGGYGVNEGLLRIYSNGRIRLIFGDEAEESAKETGLDLKSNNFVLHDSEFAYKNFTVSASGTSRQEALNDIDYIMEAFGAVFDCENPAAAPYLIYTENGAEWRYRAYDRAEDIVRSIVNYNLSCIVLTPDENMKNQLVSLECIDRLAVSEYIGDFDIISADGLGKDCPRKLFR